MDCRDNNCVFAPRPLTGMRTNGGCRCMDEYKVHSSTTHGWVYTRQAIIVVTNIVANLQNENEKLKKDLLECRENRG